VYIGLDYDVWKNRTFGGVLNIPGNAECARFFGPPGISNA